MKDIRYFIDQKEIIWIIWCLFSKSKKLCFKDLCRTMDKQWILCLIETFPNLAWQAYHILYLQYYNDIITIWSQRSLLCVTGQPGGPEGGMSSLGSSPKFVEGQGLTMVSQRMLLQLADGHGGEGARQALVHVLFTWRKIKKHKSTTSLLYEIEIDYTVLNVTFL